MPDFFAQLHRRLSWILKAYTESSFVEVISRMPTSSIGSNILMAAEDRPKSGKRTKEALYSGINGSDGDGSEKGTEDGSPKVCFLVFVSPRLSTKHGGDGVV